MAKYVGFKIGKVHESSVVSEYYCGGCGYPCTDHDSFCSECGGAFRECDASNLEAENVKLRELVRLLLYGLDHDAEPAEALVWSHEVEVLMHELGMGCDDYLRKSQEGTN